MDETQDVIEETTEERSIEPIDGNLEEIQPYEGEASGLSGGAVAGIGVGVGLVTGITALMVLSKGHPVKYLKAKKQYLAERKRVLRENASSYDKAHHFTYPMKDDEPVEVKATVIEDE